MHFLMVTLNYTSPQKFLICKISCSFCTYTVIHVRHSAKYDGRNSKIFGVLVYLVPVSGVMCHLSDTSFWSVWQFGRLLGPFDRPLMQLKGLLGQSVGLLWQSEGPLWQF